MMELPNGPSEHLQADLFGLLLSKEYVLVVQCLYSCFPAIEIVTSTLASAIIPTMDLGNISEITFLDHSQVRNMYW